jgi:NAD(P)-dependent dehydrogenase (short-subunit alcohol dehydrogenase family)
MGAARRRPAGSLAGVRVVVTDAETQLGLYVIRALGRAGCTITAVGVNTPRGVLGFSSRHTRQRCRISGPEELWTALEDLAPTHDVVVPVTTRSIQGLARQPDGFASGLRRHIPCSEAIDVAKSKARTTALAGAIGIPVPESFERLEPDTIEDWAQTSKVQLPLVVKFADDAHPGVWSPADRYRIVRSIDELSREYRRMHRVGPYPLVQEYVEGGGYGFFAVTDSRGEPVVTFCHRRLREYPITGGPSTLCESIRDPVLIDLGTRLLRALDWRGVAMVEFKRARDGQYRMLEINPRYWGSLPLALVCGVNFPQYQVELALGRSPSQPAYPVGRKMRFFLPDLLAVVETARRNGAASAFGTYLGELCDFSIKDGLFEVDDPWPFLTYVYSRLHR